MTSLMVQFVRKLYLFLLFQGREGYLNLFFCFPVQCEKVPDERRYELPLRSQYLQQVRQFIGLL